MPDCPECGGEAQIAIVNDERTLECLEIECLHWEYA